jgi:DNA gyrase/topoisomerase IV subunit B
MSGLSVVGQDYYGVFPLKGKLLNVREASPKQLQENAEIQNIKKILGLQHGKVYENVKDLRYGHLMIMADQVCTNNCYCVSTILSICHFVMLIEHYMCFVGS